MRGFEILKLFVFLGDFLVRVEKDLDALSTISMCRSCLRHGHLV